MEKFKLWINVGMKNSPLLFNLHLFEIIPALPKKGGWKGENDFKAMKGGK
jgi:hypothetical protein